jgi:hypothetical protein
MYKRPIDRTREQVIQECASATIGCWQYYAHVNLTDEQKTKIEQVLAETLPGSLTGTK